MATKEEAKAAKEAAKQKQQQTAEAENIELEGYLHVSKDEGKLWLRFCEIEERKLYMYTVGGPPDRKMNDMDIKDYIDLSLYTLQPPVEDLVDFPGFSMNPGYNAPHEIAEFQFVCRTQQESEYWQLHLDAVCNNRPLTPPDISPSIANSWVPDFKQLELASYFKIKKEGTAWMDWDLRWVELDVVDQMIRIADFKKFSYGAKFGGENKPKPTGTYPLNGATIVAGKASAKGIEHQMFKISAPDQPVMYFYAEDRATVIQWVHILQQISGQRELQLVERGEINIKEDADQRENIREQVRTMSIRNFAYVRRNAGQRWTPKLVIMKKLQVLIFEPFQPTDRKITSDDSILLEEPFAVQEFDSNGNGVSILTHSGRYCFNFSNLDECSRWIKLLQLAWHCTRPDGVDQGELPNMMSAYKAADAAGSGLIQDTLAGLLQWQKPGQPWTLGWLDLDSDALAIHGLNPDPMVMTGPIQITVPMGGASIYDLEGQNTGLRGFLIDRGPLDKTSVLLVDEGRVQMWLDAVKAHVSGQSMSGSSNTLTGTPASTSAEPMPSTSPISTNLASGITTQSQASAPSTAAQEVDDADLADLLGLDVPTVDDQLSELDGLNIGGGNPPAPPPSQLVSQQQLAVASGGLTAAPVATEPPPTAILQGILEAKGAGLGKKAQPNFFVLDPRFLTCFAHRDDKNKKAEFLLSRLSDLQSGEEDGKSFSATYGGENVHFKAKSVREADMWVTSLAKLIAGND